MRKAKENIVSAVLKDYCNYDINYKSPTDRRRHVTRITGCYFINGIEYRRSYFADKNTNINAMKELCPLKILVDLNK